VNVAAHVSGRQLVSEAITNFETAMIGILNLKLGYTEVKPPTEWNLTEEEIKTKTQ
jgi:hypothetical protein